MYIDVITSQLVMLRASPAGAEGLVAHTVVESHVNSHC